MGDRGNIYVKDADVYLYSHWGGYDLSLCARDALKKAPDRWTDAMYLARVMFQSMLCGDDSSTGFGISHLIGDNERPVIVIDPDAQTASVTKWRGHDSKSVDDVRSVIPFSRLVEMNDDECREWHLGKDES